MANHTKYIIVCLFCLTFATGQATAAEMSVEHAYKRLGHQQTPFKKSQARMSDAEKDYLDHLFFVTDMAFSERMTMLKYFEQGNDNAYIAKYNEEIENLLHSFDLITVPNEKLGHVENLVTDAIKEQRKFFNKWNKAGKKFNHKKRTQNFIDDEHVRNAHRKLLKAYAILKNEYPQEGQHNQKAFYDHLCALDFI